REVNAVFLALPGWGSVRSGIIATSGSGELWLKGNGAYVDSYDSSVGPYADSRSSNGIVEAAGDVTLSGNSDIEGDVRSGDVVEFASSTASINGDVYWTTDFIDPWGGMTGTATQIDGVDTVGPIDGFVHLSMDIIQAENDNDATGGVIESDQLVIASKGSAELGAGSYYLEKIDLVGQELTLDTTEGDVYIGVRDYMSLTPDGSTGAKITVQGDGVVRIFVLGAATTTASGSGLKGSEREVNLHVGQSSSVYVPDDRSPQLRLYGTESLTVAIGGSESNLAAFTGVIYAPAGLTGPSRVYVKKADVYGQIVTANLTLGQDGKVHYDLALQGVPLPRSNKFDRLEFMHVAVHRVDVSERDR
ncbi:MAG: hypothetical protein R3324_17330, partial [Halobacteriales archaeon]|nr:hypothetical protein [Halobacteriales archaeon]